MRLFKYYRWLLLALLLIPMATQAQFEPEPTPTAIATPELSLTVGDSLMVQVDEAGQAGEVYITLEIPEAGYYTIAARSQDSTNPLFQLFNAVQREIIYIDDNPDAVSVEQASDAILEDLFLTPGNYFLRIERGDTPGDGEITVSVSEGSAGLLGAGQITVIETELPENGRVQLPVTLGANEILSVYAIALENDPDLMLGLFDETGASIAENDDHESNEWVLGDFDPKLDQVLIPETGEYLVEVRGFSEIDTGTLTLVIARYGFMNPSEREDLVFSTETLSQGRNPFSLDLNTGDLLTITARAGVPNMDLELFLLDPRLVYVARNDDHQSASTDLDEFDPRIANYLAEQSGTYIMEVNSVSGRGAFEAVVEFLGNFETGDFEPLDVSGLQVFSAGE